MERTLVVVIMMIMMVTVMVMDGVDSGVVVGWKL